MRLLRNTTLICCLLFSGMLFAQSDSTRYGQDYLERSTRFAWLTYGGDINYLSGGTSQVLLNGSLQDVNFGSTIMPRLTIGGVHFWGHVDFYVTFPLSFLSLQQTPNQLSELEIYQGVETGARLYPFKLKQGRLSPFAGISFRRIRFLQEAVESDFSNGVPGYGQIIYPIQTGLTYTTKQWHITASAYYNYQNEFDYFVTPTDQAAVTLNPLSFNISFLKYVDSDRHMRNKNAAEKINKQYSILEKNDLLSTWFFGIGPSAVLQLNRSPFLEQNYPYFADEYSAAVLPDLSFGRYFHKPDMNLNLVYRTYGDSYEGFDSQISIRRHSVGIESVKFLFNYLGFVPFVGPIVSYENLRARVDGNDYVENKMALGFTFGWDIRVTKTGSSLLRTNLRYYPDLHMKINDEKMMFDHLEFNFIQWVQFIGRKKAYRRS